MNRLFLKISHGFRQEFRLRHFRPSTCRMRIFISMPRVFFMNSHGVVSEAGAIKSKGLLSLPSVGYTFMFFALILVLVTPLTRSGMNSYVSRSGLSLVRCLLRPMRNAGINFSMSPQYMGAYAVPSMRIMQEGSSSQRNLRSCFKRNQGLNGSPHSIPYARMDRGIFQDNEEHDRWSQTSSMEL